MMGLRADLLQGIYAYGIEKPSCIQRRAIMATSSGCDVIARAPSGGGKTACCVISILQILDVDLKQCQVLLMVPTWELACGTRHVVTELAKFMSVSCEQCVIDTDVRGDQMKLSNWQHIVVGTPQCIEEKLDRKLLNPNNTKLVVLDEVDEMFKRGFKDSIINVIKLLPHNIQIILSLSTMPDSVKEFTENFMRKPIEILVKDIELTLGGTRQYYISIDQESDKLKVLSDLFECPIITSAIIYCTTRRKVDWLADKLGGKGYLISKMHGQMDQSERNATFEEFNLGLTKALILTELLAENVLTKYQFSPVINYDMPLNLESYAKRLGRSGAFGRLIVAINFVTPGIHPSLQEIEKFYNVKIEEMPIDASDIL